MLKFHPIPAFMKKYTNFKKIFLVRVFWLKYIFRIKFKIPILDLMLLPKNSVPFEKLYSSNLINHYKSSNETTAKIFSTQSQRKNIEMRSCKNRVFSEVHKVRTLLKDWPTLRSFFSGNLIEH